MSLKQQFEEVIICTEIEGCSKQSDDCIKIAYNFAISFAKWLTKKGNYNINNWNKTMEEMLEIYKKEKGL